MTMIFFKWRVNLLCHVLWTSKLDILLSGKMILWHLILALVIHTLWVLFVCPILYLLKRFEIKMTHLLFLLCPSTVCLLLEHFKAFLVRLSLFWWVWDSVHVIGVYWVGLVIYVKNTAFIWTTKEIKTSSNQTNLSNLQKDIIPRTISMETLENCWFITL